MKNKKLTEEQQEVWDRLKHGLSARDWNSVAYGNGTFVAVGIDNRIMTSVDGVAWVFRQPAATRLWTKVDYQTFDLFTVITDNGESLMDSVDGITWTLRRDV